MAGITPNTVIRVPSSKKDIFRHWLAFLFPFHHLTERETDIAVAFLRERHELSKVINDNEILDRILMSEETHRKIRQECGVTSQHFQVIKSKLKSKKFFIDNRVNPKLIPNVKEDRDTFQLLLVFPLV